jgi:hypothetical protein
MRPCLSFAAVAAVGLLSFACAAKPEPIRLEGRWVWVENQTTQDWSDVEVWVNDHYRVTRAKIQPGERFQIPLDAFVAGFGQRFNPVQQHVTGVLIVGRTADAPLRIEWGTVRRK